MPPDGPRKHQNSSSSSGQGEALYKRIWKLYLPLLIELNGLPNSIAWRRAVGPALVDNRIFGPDDDDYEEPDPTKSPRIINNAISQLRLWCLSLLDQIGPTPRIFIGSSSEGRPIEVVLQRLLQSEYNVSRWDEDGVIPVGLTIIEALESAASQHDFGIFVFTPDDERRMRGELSSTPRDNVVFAIGLFIGYASREATFMLRQSDAQMDLPADLAGIEWAGYARPNGSV